MRPQHIPCSYYQHRPCETAPPVLQYSGRVYSGNSFPHRLLAWWRTRRSEAKRLTRARRELDELFFRRPEVLAGGRLKPHHRGRATILEIEEGKDGAVERILFGIVRHPKPHPLAPRGDDVLELIEYWPRENRLTVAGSKNLRR